VVLNCKEKINYLTYGSIKRFRFPILALIKRGKKGIIRIRKLSNGGNIIKESWELIVKSVVKIVRNLQLRTF
jgi:hypothetical protein